MEACEKDYIEVVQLFVDKYDVNINHQDKVMQSDYCQIINSHHITCFAYIFVLRVDIHLPMLQLKSTI